MRTKNIVLLLQMLGGCWKDSLLSCSQTPLGMQRQQQRPLYSRFARPWQQQKHHHKPQQQRQHQQQQLDSSYTTCRAAKVVLLVQCKQL
jgi:hypothetical protein